MMSCGLAKTDYVLCDVDQSKWEMVLALARCGTEATMVDRDKAARTEKSNKIDWPGAMDCYDPMYTRQTTDIQKTTHSNDLKTKKCIISVKISYRYWYSMLF